MSVLERYLNTEKYQGVMRELAIAQILNEKSKPGLSLRPMHPTAAAGWVKNLTSPMQRPTTSMSSTLETLSVAGSSRAPAC